MKNILFLLAFLPLFAFGQTPLSDTTYVKQIGVNFYEVTRFVYDTDGNEYNERQKLIGDSITLYTVRKNKFEQRGKDLAIEVQATSTFGKEITAILRQSDRTEALTGINPLDSLQKENIEYYTGNTFQILGDSIEELAFTVTAAGNLRCKVNNGTNKNVTVIGREVVRINNYPTQGKSTDFFSNGRAIFLTQDGKKRIRRTSANRN